MKNKIYFLMVLFSYTFAMGQTPFYIAPETSLPVAPPSMPTPTVYFECTGNFIPEMLISNTYASYKWEFSDGRTATGYNPQALAFNKLGTYTGKLTITSERPFKVLKSISINKTNHSWYNSISDIKPDYYVNVQLGSRKIFKTNQYQDTKSPVTYTMYPGIFLEKSLDLDVYDSDTFGDDFLGSVTIPAGYAGGKLGNGYDFEIEIVTESVNSIVFEFNITVKTFPTNIKDECLDHVHTLSLSTNYTTYKWSDGSTGKTLVTSVPGTYTVTVTNANGCAASDQIVVNNTTDPQPAIDCISSTLYCNNYNDAQVQWLRQDLTPITGATKKQFTPTQPGIYYVRTSGLGKCKLTSEPISWPDCKTVASDDTPQFTDAKVYPNPTDGILNIDTPTDDRLNIMVINNLGQPVNFTKLEHSIDITNHPAGIYYVLLISNNTTKRFKIVKN